MKQKWDEPRLVEMGVENTNEDDIMTLDIAAPFPGGATVAKCRECGVKFYTPEAFNAHRNDPGHDPLNDLVDYLQS